jgi:hypothetical protein
MLLKPESMPEESHDAEQSGGGFAAWPDPSEAARAATIYFKPA